MFADLETVDCPANKTVPEGSNFTLRCSANADDDSRALISWEKDGEALNTSEPGMMISGTDSPSQLSILGATPTDAGLYTCIAKNNNSGVTKACPEARVTVQCK